MTTSVNYSGRTLDILVMGGIDPTILGIQPDSLAFGNPSQYVAGIQKLIQRYTILFLTITGSQPNTPTFGTGFLQTVSVSSRISTNALNHAFNFANLIILTQFRAYQKANPGLPLDEQINTANLISSSIVGTTLNLTIGINSLAGVSAPFLLPLPLSS